MKIALFLIALSSSLAIAQSSPGSCGSLGCDENKKENNRQLIIAILDDSDVKDYMANNDITSIKQIPDEVANKYQITLSNRQSICVNIGYVEVKSQIDGKWSVNINGRETVILPTQARCQ